MDSQEVDFESRGYSKHQIDMMNKLRKASAVTSLGIRFNTDLKNYPCYNFDLYATLFSQYDKHGTLPFSGALSEQPNFIIEVFNTLKGLVTEAQIKTQKAQEQPANRRK